MLVCSFASHNKYMTSHSNAYVFMAIFIYLCYCGCCCCFPFSLLLLLVLLPFYFGLSIWWRLWRATHFTFFYEVETWKIEKRQNTKSTFYMRMLAFVLGCLHIKYNRFFAPFCYYFVCLSQVLLYNGVHKQVYVCRIVLFCHTVDVSNFEQCL